MNGSGNQDGGYTHRIGGDEHGNLQQYIIINNDEINNGKNINTYIFGEIKYKHDRILQLLCDNINGIPRNKYHHRNRVIY